MGAGSEPDMQTTPSGASSASVQVATDAVRLWTQVTAALAPIIGQRGVAALYRRSLGISSAAYPMLTGLDESAETDHPYSALQQALAKLDAALAQAASDALADSFHKLLTTLIGAALTERLLRDVWPSPSSNSGHAVEDRTT